MALRREQTSPLVYDLAWGFVPQPRVMSVPLCALCAALVCSTVTNVSLSLSLSFSLSLSSTVCTVLRTLRNLEARPASVPAKRFLLPFLLYVPAVPAVTYYVLLLHITQNRHLWIREFLDREISCSTLNYLFNLHT